MTAILSQPQYVNWTYVHLLSMKTSGIHSRVMFTWILNSLVHDVNASGHVCVGKEFELEFGCQFDVTSTNMADVVHTMTDV